MIARIPQILASVVAVSLTGYAAWTNCRAAIESTPEAVYWAGAGAEAVYWAGAGAILVAVALSITAASLAHGLRSRNGTLVLSSLLGAVLFGWLALQSALDVVGNARMNTAASAGDTVAAKSKAQSAYDRASKRLDAMAPARPAAEIEAVIGQRSAIIGDHDCDRWVPNKVRVACDARASDKAELGRAVERERLTADMTEATDTLSKLSGQRSVGNASTTLIAEFTGKEAHVIDRLVILMRALGIEFGGSLLSMVAVSLGSARRVPHVAVDMALSKRHGTPLRDTEKTCPIVPPVNQSETVAEQAVERVPDVSHLGDEKLAVGDTPEGRLLDMLRERGGKVFGSQRTIGLAVGVSSAHINRVIHDLETAGHVKVSTSKRGTVIELKQAA
jgi:hypothetical protein